MPILTRVRDPRLLVSRRRSCTALLVLSVLLGSSVVFGQAAETQNPLASIKELKCRYPVAATATWSAATPEARTRTQELNATISAIDVQDGTAEYSGTAGTAHVSAILSGSSLYFVETGVGQLNVTIVFAQENAPKTLKAVHSRHGYIQMSIGTYTAQPNVSQNYGECEIVR